MMAFAGGAFSLSPKAVRGLPPPPPTPPPAEAARIQEERRRQVSGEEDGSDRDGCGGLPKAAPHGERDVPGNKDGKRMYKVDDSQYTIRTSSRRDADQLPHRHTKQRVLDTIATPRRSRHLPPRSEKPPATVAEASKHPASDVSDSREDLLKEQVHQLRKKLKKLQSERLVQEKTHREKQLILENELSASNRSLEGVKERLNVLSAENSRLQAMLRNGSAGTDGEAGVDAKQNPFYRAKEAGKMNFPVASEILQTQNDPNQEEEACNDQDTSFVPLNLSIEALAHFNGLQDFGTEHGKGVSGSEDGKDRNLNSSQAIPWLETPARAKRGSRSHLSGGSLTRNIVGKDGASSESDGYRSDGTYQEGPASGASSIASSPAMHDLFEHATAAGKAGVSDLELKTPKRSSSRKRGTGLSSVKRMNMATPGLSPIQSSGGSETLNNSCASEALGEGVASEQNFLAVSTSRHERRVHMHSLMTMEIDEEVAGTKLDNTASVSQDSNGEEDASLKMFSPLKTPGKLEQLVMQHPGGAPIIQRGDLPKVSLDFGDEECSEKSRQIASRSGTLEQPREPSGQQHSRTNDDLRFSQLAQNEATSEKSEKNAEEKPSLAATGAAAASGSRLAQGGYGGGIDMSSSMLWTQANCSGMRTSRNEANFSAAIWEAKRLGITSIDTQWDFAKTVTRAEGIARSRIAVGNFESGGVPVSTDTRMRSGSGPALSPEGGLSSKSPELPHWYVKPSSSRTSPPSDPVFAFEAMRPDETCTKFSSSYWASKLGIAKTNAHIFSDTKVGSSRLPLSATHSLEQHYKYQSPLGR